MARKNQFKENCDKLRAMGYEPEKMTIRQMFEALGGQPKGEPMDMIKAVGRAGYEPPKKEEHKTVSIPRKLKDAIHSAVKARANHMNKGMLADYDTNDAEKLLLLKNDVKIRCEAEWIVTMGGKVIATGERRFSKLGRTLIPKLVYVKRDEEVNDKADIMTAWAEKMLNRPLHDYQRAAILKFVKEA